MRGLGDSQATPTAPWVLIPVHWIPSFSLLFWPWSVPRVMSFGKLCMGRALYPHVGPVVLNLATLYPQEAHGNAWRPFWGLLKQRVGRFFWHFSTWIRDAKCSEMLGASLHAAPNVRSDSPPGETLLIKTRAQEPHSSKMIYSGAPFLLKWELLWSLSDLGRILHLPSVSLCPDHKHLEGWCYFWSLEWHLQHSRFQLGLLNSMNWIAFHYFMRIWTRIQTQKVWEG